MKKIIIFLVLLISGVVNLSALEQIRVSLTTTPFSSRDVYIDILIPDGGASGIARITKTGISTDEAGVLSFIIDESTWTDLIYTDVKNYIVKITLHRGTGDEVLLTLQRLEDLINRQGLFGARISPEDIDQTQNFTFKSISIKTGNVELKDADGSNGITLKAPETLHDNLELIFPPDNGWEGQLLTTDGQGKLSWSIPSGNDIYWRLLGNTNTNPIINFVGTTDDKDLVFRINNLESGRITRLTSNTSLGYQSLSSTTPGTANVAFGYLALKSNTGIRNSAVGCNALKSNTSAGNNTALGHYSLYSNTTGSDNTATGTSSIFTNSTGSFNTASGSSTLYSNTTGSYNIAFGGLALNMNSTGANNTGIGWEALYTNTLGNENTAVGNNSLGYNTTGNCNSALGFWAGTRIGTQDPNQTSSNSVYLGSWSKASADGNTNEIVIGYNAIGKGSNTVTLGNASMSALYCVGAYNSTSTNQPNLYVDANGQIIRSTTSLGSLYWSLTGNSGTTPGTNFIGTTDTKDLIFKANNYESGRINVLNRNASFGYRAFFSNSGGQLNTAFGAFALTANTIGGQNTATGNQALGMNTSGYSNTAFGSSALYSNLTGEYNSALGLNSGNWADAQATNTTSDYSVYIGAETKAYADGDQNEIVIGYNALGAGSNTITLGNTAIVTTVLRGNVTVGTCLTLAPSSAPATPTEGTIYYDSASHTLNYWNGSAWVAM